MKTFKRAISSILAFVMVFSMITVLNVSNAFAVSASDYSYKYVFSGTTTPITVKDTDSNTLATITLLGNWTYSSGIKPSSNSDRPSQSNGLYSSGCAIQIEVTKKCTVHIDRKLGNNKTLLVDDMTNNKNILSATNSTGSSIGNTINYEDYKFTAETGIKYVAYVTGTGDQFIGVYFEPISNDPSLSLNPTELSLAPGESGTITATLSNSTDTISYSSDNDNITVEASDTGAEVAVSKDATIGDKATITATAGTLTAECVVTVVDPTNDIIIKGSAGLKKVTLTGKTTGSTATLEWVRDGSNEISKNDSNFDYSTAGLDTSSNQRGYYRTATNMPYDTYIATAEYVTEYYEGTESFEIDATSKLSTTVATLTITATRKDGGAIRTEGFDYDGVSGGKISWKFNEKGSINDYLSLQGVGDYGIYSSSGTEGYYMVVNTENNGGDSNGKFNSVDRSKDIQVNVNTVLTLYATPGTTFEFTGNSDIKLTIDGTEYENGDTYTYNGTEAKAAVTATVTTSGYLYTIYATYPEQPIVQTIADPTTDGAVGVYKSGTTYYVLSQVSATAVKESGDKLIGQQLSGATAPYATSSKVYSGVKLTDTETVTASDGTYLWGVKIINVPESVEDETIKAISTVYVTATE